MADIETLDIVLIGAGMFATEVHIPNLATLALGGISPTLGRIGMNHHAPRLANCKINLVGIATSSEQSAFRARDYYRSLTNGMVEDPQLFYGQATYLDMFDTLKPHVAIVCTPDDFHVKPSIDAMERGIDVIVEKPPALTTYEIDQMIETAVRMGLILCPDVHKRYDPGVVLFREKHLEMLGTLVSLYAILEEPITVSTDTFSKWVERSSPTRYVGIHYIDAFNYIMDFSAKPVAVHASGIKKVLAGKGINSFDEDWVTITYENGVIGVIKTNWIVPKVFGPVNQYMEVTGENGKLELDTQNRGYWIWINKLFNRSFNPNFVRQVTSPESPNYPYVSGYGPDSVNAGLTAIMRRRNGATREELIGTYPSIEELRWPTAIIEAADVVKVMNHDYATRKPSQGAPVTARFGDYGIEICDPIGGNKIIYDQPI